MLNCNNRLAGLSGNKEHVISKISVYRVLIPFHPLGSLWVGRQKPTHLDSTVVIVETDTGLSGVGESCPIGSVYLPAFAAGLRAGVAEMAPALLGQDATQVAKIYQSMDAALYGHGYAKAAIDIACWDLFGKACNLPVSALMGGRQQDAIPAYASIPLRGAEEMVATLKQKQSEGFCYFQLKIGDDPKTDCINLRAIVEHARPGDLFMADANRGWSQADALSVIDEVNAIDCYLEQPCASYAACQTVRVRCQRPFILDEIIDGPRDLARAIAEDALDGLVIKVTHAGGLTPARIERDICVSQGIKIRIEDTAGTEIARAAQAQLAAATPASMLLGSYTFINDLPPVVDGAPEIRNGMLHLNSEPGLGVTPRPDALGKPVAVYG